MKSNNPNDLESSKHSLSTDSNHPLSNSPLPPDTDEIPDFIPNSAEHTPVLKQQHADDEYEEEQGQ